jgi:RNA-directed DNA polymerase
MLTALVTGLKGNKWFRLIDKVYRPETLQLAWEKVQSNAGGSGVDGITVGRFAKDCPRGLLVLNEQLRQATYQPKPVKRSGYRSPVRPRSARWESRWCGTGLCRPHCEW